jgi:hypothetical protein
MVANTTESGIPRTAAGPKFAERRFFIRVCPLDLGEHMLSQYLLVDVDIDMLDGENRPPAA